MELHAVESSVHAFAVSLVVCPLPLVHVSVRVDQSSPDVGLVVEPVAFVFAPIFPDLHAFAMSLALGVPLAHINRAKFIDYYRFFVNAVLKLKIIMAPIEGVQRLLSKLCLSRDVLTVRNSIDNSSSSRVDFRVSLEPVFNFYFFVV